MTEYLGIPAEKRWLRKKQQINPKRHKDGKFQWQYKEWKYMGIAVQPSLLMLKKDEFKPEVVKRKAVRIVRELDSLS